MTERALIDAYQSASLRGYLRLVALPLVVTVQTATVTQDAYGQLIETWTTTASMRAAKDPLRAEEMQAAGYTITDRAWHVYLDGAYPGITTSNRLVIGGEPFDIDSVETDQTTSLTRLRARQVEV